MKPEWFEQGIARANNECESRHGFKIIKFCRGQIRERDFYAFVAIEPDTLGYFEDHYKAGQSTNFKPFGHELLRGWGSTPPQDIIEHLQLKYNIEFGVEPAYIKHLAGLALEAKEKPDNAQSPFPEQPAFRHPEDYPGQSTKALGS